MKILQKVLGGLLFFDSHCTSVTAAASLIRPTTSGRTYTFVGCWLARDTVAEV